VIRGFEDGQWRGFRNGHRPKLVARIRQDGEGVRLRLAKVNSRRFEARPFLGAPLTLGKEVEGTCQQRVEGNEKVAGTSFDSRSRAACATYERHVYYSRRAKRSRKVAIFGRSWRISGPLKSWRSSPQPTVRLSISNSESLILS
jgi:hypothetical protein